MSCPFQVVFFFSYIGKPIATPDVGVLQFELSEIL